MTIRTINSASTDRLAMFQIEIAVLPAPSGPATALTNRGAEHQRQRNRNQHQQHQQSDERLQGTQLPERPSLGFAKITLLSRVNAPT